ncbi:MAG: nickel-dependent lactate racemase [Candidatus Lokiarchaeota archaeon]|nr:nickel-dependent lactate racemase [Candidatus Lokiarchaeota archaeon]
MKVDYGKTGLNIKLNSNWNVEILYPKEQNELQNPVEKIRNAIKNPIGIPSLIEIIKKKRIQKIGRVCIVVSDATRPVPSKFILKGLIKELNSYGIDNRRITILIATGLHRKSREDELNRILGRKLKDRVKIIDHDAKDEGMLKKVRKTSDNIPIFINKHYLESDIKILTGYVEPHFFFGFSGGRKSIVPGIAGEKTIRRNHSAKNISSEFARFGVYKDNPMHIMALEVAKKVGVDFIINVCINENHNITKISAGHLEKVHQKLVNYQLDKIFANISEPYDIVICGNGGYPLDLNLYQAVKGMAIGEMAVKEGGTIISVNELSDGIGQESFKDLLFSGENPENLHRKIINKEIETPDQWEIQILTRILKKADIYVISSLNEESLGNIGLKYSESVEEAIRNAQKKYGENARILILPHGPQILPKLKR